MDPTMYLASRIPGSPQSPDQTEIDAFYEEHAHAPHLPDFSAIAPYLHRVTRATRSFTYLRKTIGFGAGRPA